MNPRLALVNEMQEILEDAYYGYKEDKQTQLIVSDASSNTYHPFIHVYALLAQVRHIRF